MEIYKEWCFHYFLSVCGIRDGETVGGVVRKRVTPEVLQRIQFQKEEQLER